MDNLEKKEAPKKNDVTKVKFKLSAEHTHKGEDFKKDNVIELRKYQADALKEQGKGAIVNG